MNPKSNRLGTLQHTEIFDFFFNPAVLDQPRRGRTLEGISIYQYDLSYLVSQKLGHFGEVSQIIGHDASFEHVPRKERKELTTFELPSDLQWSSTCKAIETSECPGMKMKNV